jgi:hypothetical protein
MTKEAVAKIECTCCLEKIYEDEIEECVECGEIVCECCLVMKELSLVCLDCSD